MSKNNQKVLLYVAQHPKGECVGSRFEVVPGIARRLRELSSGNPTVMIFYDDGAYHLRIDGEEYLLTTGGIGSLTTLGEWHAVIKPFSDGSTSVSIDFWPGKVPSAQVRVSDLV